jgi:acetyl-CoA acetyltransferase
MAGLARQVAVAGIGTSRRRADDAAGVELLARDACMAALVDAGLSGNDVDGIFEYRFGTDSPDCVTVQRQLGVPDLAAYSDIENTGPSGLAAVLAATMAVGSGACEVAIAFRCITKVAGHALTLQQAGPRVAAGRGGSRLQYLTLYGDTQNILIAMALRKQRRMAEFGNSPVEYGRVAVNARRWGAMNPEAALPQAITMDDYLSSRPIVDPLLLLDCDYPTNGACAAVVTTVERAHDMRRKPVEIEAISFGVGTNGDWTFDDDFLFGGTVPCSRRLWDRSQLSANDIDVAEVYDGFTHIAISWVEALGFCGRGEFSDWVNGGATIGPGGALPLNTSGGQLSEGRLHGLGLFVEGVRQLRGECGLRQVAGATTAVVANAFGPQCGALTLIQS